MRKRFILSFASIVFLSSCTLISYTPRVSLDVSPVTINRSLQVEKFEDLSPDDDREIATFGSSATNEAALANDLNLELTRSIIDDFSSNYVFRSVGRKIENPDFILKGKIKRFKAITRLTNYASVSLWLVPTSYVAALMILNPLPLIALAPDVSLLCGAPAYVMRCEIELEISIYDKNGNLLNTYTGQDKRISRSDIYSNINNGLPNQANRVLSKVVQQIRDQIVADVAKY